MAVYNMLPQGEGLTLLWENPSPSSNLASGFQTALSDPTVFDKYRVVWQMTTQVDGNEMQIDYARLSSQASMSGGNWSWALAMTIRAGGNTTYSRRITVENNTQFWIGPGEPNSGTGNHNDYLIPLRIYGIQ